MTWGRSLVWLFLMCNGVLLVIVATPLQRWLDVIPLLMGLTQMGSVAVATGATMARSWMTRRAVLAEAEFYARRAANTQRKGQ